MIDVSILFGTEMNQLTSALNWSLTETNTWPVSILSDLISILSDLISILSDLISILSDLISIRSDLISYMDRLLTKGHKYLIFVPRFVN